MKHFYETEKGHEKLWNPSESVLKEYKEICFTIWGGCPYDVTWAKGTAIYQNALQNFTS